MQGRNRCGHAGSLFGTCLRSQGASEERCPKAGGCGFGEGLAGDGGVDLPASGNVAQGVELRRDLLVTGSGKGRRPGSEGHRQRAQQQGPWRAGHTVGWGPRLGLQGPRGLGTETGSLDGAPGRC